MGYGSESVKQLIEIFSKNSKTEISQNFKNSETDFSEILNSSKNNFQNLQQNRTEKALLKSSKELFFENVDWIGASFGLTQKLLNFWGKNGFSPVYVRQSKNYLTGEHSCIVLKSLKTLKFGCNDKQNESDKSDLLKFYRNEFLRRFVSLLSISFRDLDVSTALSILQNLVNIDENGLK
ncbi:N-acetyltransferase 10, partial [Bonamia ostreae]